MNLMLRTSEMNEPYLSRISGVNFETALSSLTQSMVCQTEGAKSLNQSRDTRMQETQVLRSRKVAIRDRISDRSRALVDEGLSLVICISWVLSDGARTVETGREKGGGIVDV